MNVFWLQPNSEKWNETEVQNPFADHAFVDVPGKADEPYEVQVISFP